MHTNRKLALQVEKLAEKDQELAWKNEELLAKNQQIAAIDLKLYYRYVKFNRLINSAGSKIIRIFGALRIIKSK